MGVFRLEMAFFLFWCTTSFIESILRFELFYERFLHHFSDTPFITVRPYRSHRYHSWRFTTLSSGANTRARTFIEIGRWRLHTTFGAVKLSHEIQIGCQLRMRFLVLWQRCGSWLRLLLSSGTTISLLLSGRFRYSYIASDHSICRSTLVIRTYSATLTLLFVQLPVNMMECLLVCRFLILDTHFLQLLLCILILLSRWLVKRVALQVLLVLVHIWVIAWGLDQIIWNTLLKGWQSAMSLRQLS